MLIDNHSLMEMGIEAAKALHDIFAYLVEEGSRIRSRHYGENLERLVNELLARQQAILTATFKVLADEDLWSNFTDDDPLWLNLLPLWKQGAISIEAVQAALFVEDFDYNRGHGDGSTAYYYWRSVVDSHLGLCMNGVCMYRFEADEWEQKLFPWLAEAKTFYFKDSEYSGKSQVSEDEALGFLEDYEEAEDGIEAYI